MSEDERQPCLNDNKGENTVLDSDCNSNEVTNVKENECTEAQPLNEHEEVSLSDKCLNELEPNETVSTVSELQLNNDAKVRDNIDPSDVGVINEEQTVKEVNIKTRNNSESNDIDESHEDLKEASDESTSEEETNGEKVSNFMNI